MSVVLKFLAWNKYVFTRINILKGYFILCKENEKINYKEIKRKMYLNYVLSRSSLTTLTRVLTFNRKKKIRKNVSRYAKPPFISFLFFFF